MNGGYHGVCEEQPGVVEAGSGQSVTMGDYRAYRRRPGMVMDGGGRPGS